MKCQACLLSFLLCCQFFTSRGLELSSLESFTLKSRLGEVQHGVRQKYSGNGHDALLFRTNRCFIFPGAGGVDDLVTELQSVLSKSTIIDWKEYRGSVLTAAFEGEAVGEAIASIYGDPGANEEIHYVGISVGGFCANSAATFAKKEFPDANVRLTLLDPFCGRGILNPTYGRTNFGKFATTAVHILNTDDPVPTTNDPLPNCFCLDVTEASERDSFVLLEGDTMHSWPVAYFARHFSTSPWAEGPFERGVVVKV